MLTKTPSTFKTCASCDVRHKSICDPLCQEDVSRVLSYKKEERSYPAKEDIFLQGSHRTELMTILEGWAFNYETTENGNRQITKFTFPGDFVGFSADTDVPLAYSVQTLTPVRVCVFDHDKFYELLHNHSGLAFRLIWMVSREEVRLQKLLTMVSRRPALDRVALLLLDIICRIEGCSRSLVSGRKVDLPITQEHMADALGLTPIHVNRMLQKLRKAGIISLEHGVLRILDPQRITDNWGLEHEAEGYKVSQSGQTNAGNLRVILD